VRQSHRFTVYVLLLVFSLIALKNLLPDLDHTHDNCDEIGHVHFYHIEFSKKTLNTPPLTTDDDECHAGKALFSYSMFPAQEFKILIPDFNFTFKFIFNIQNNFKNPFLEPQRKPPRAA
jgi:hypothetical protein